MRAEGKIVTIVRSEGEDRDCSGDDQVGHLAVAAVAGAPMAMAEARCKLSSRIEPLVNFGHPTARKVEAGKRAHTDWLDFHWDAADRTQVVAEESCQTSAWEDGSVDEEAERSSNIDQRADVIRYQTVRLTWDW